MKGEIILHCLELIKYIKNIARCLGRKRLLSLVFTKLIFKLSLNRC